MRRRLFFAIQGATYGILAIAVLITFLPVLGNAFVYDDWQYVVLNPHIQKGLTTDAIAWAFTSTYAGNWHPVTWLSHILDFQAFGLKPAGHHLMNLLIHAVNVVLLLALLSRMTGNFWRSAVVAGVFGLHPLRLESVAWVAERKDVLSMLFWLLTMWAYVSYADSKHKDSRTRAVGFYVLTIVLYTIGLMSKPMLVSLPLVLLFIDYWPLRRLGGLLGRQLSRSAKRLSLRGAFVEKLPLFVISLSSCGITYYAQQKGQAVALTQDYPIWARLANAASSYVGYLGKCAWPRHLAVLYPHPGVAVSLKMAGLGVLVVAAFTVFALVSIRRRPYLTVGWFWYLGTLIPVIGLVQVGVQAMADRYTYIPTIGILVAVVWGIGDWLGTAGGRGNSLWCGGACWSAVVAIIGLALCTRIQTGYWRNNETLYRRAVACTTANYVMLNNLGLELLDKGRVDEAIRFFRRGLSIAPNFHVLHMNLGKALAEKGQLEEATAAYKTAIKLRPDYADAHNNLGLVLYEQGKLGEAIKEYETALRYDPNHADAHYNIASLLAEQGSFEKAVAHLRRAISARPFFADAHYNLGNVLVRLGRFGEAAEEFAQVVRINPRDGEAHYKLGNTLLKMGKHSEAVRSYEKALEITPSMMRARNNLAVALYLSGRYKEAWEQVRILSESGGSPHPGFLAALRSKMPEP